MTLLFLAGLAWLGLHLGLAGTRARRRLVAWLGERGFVIGYSVLSVISITLLVSAYNSAETRFLWVAPLWIRLGIAAVMPLAFILVVASLTIRNPTAVGGAPGTAPARGILRVTRHPMLAGFALWSALHMIGNGDTASLVFFGTILVTAVVGMPSIDAKLATRDPAGFGALAANTSRLPFAAITAGRNRFVARELGWVAPLVGLLLWAGLLHAHAWLFGINPVGG